MAYCNWDATSEVNVCYHAKEWGVPDFDDDRHHFEHLMMEVMQCGLSWDLVINRREVFRECFDDFDYEKVAKYDEKDIERIMGTPGMIRSSRKIKAIIANARAFIKFREEHGSFARYLWGHSGGKVIVYDKHPEGYIPASNGLSRDIADELKRAGFKFVGPITIYSHLQSVGVIHDHSKDCPRHKEILSRHEFVKMPCDREVGVKYYG